MRGYAVMRPCRSGYKIGPLFAANADVANSLLVGLGSRVPGEPIFLDVPEINGDALALVRRYDMREVFGCARLFSVRSRSSPLLKSLALQRLN